MAQPILFSQGYGFIFSIPTAVIILGSESMSKSMNNEVQLAVIALAFFAAFPWSIVTCILYLMTFSMHGTTALAIQYVAFAILLVGAHLNAVFLYSPKPDKFYKSASEANNNKNNQRPDV